MDRDRSYEKSALFLAWTFRLKKTPDGYVRSRDPFACCQSASWQHASSPSRKKQKTREDRDTAQTTVRRDIPHLWFV